MNFSKALILLLACTPRAETGEDTGPAPMDTTATAPMDTATTPDTSVATPPITPPQSDTPPAQAKSDTTSPQADTTAGQAPAGDTPAQSGTVSRLEYEGWRQYNANCARCHGQDALPNPVAANLLVSAAPGGPVSAKEPFVQVVSEGRPHRGMPAFKDLLTPSQTEAIYAYVKGRAEKRIPPGRPAAPGG